MQLKRKLVIIFMTSLNVQPFKVEICNIFAAFVLLLLRNSAATAP